MHPPYLWAAVVPPDDQKDLGGIGSGDRGQELALPRHLPATGIEEPHSCILGVSSRDGF